MPGVSKSVQFRGIKNVLKAYNNAKVPSWALWSGSQLFNKYEGTDMEEGSQTLEDYLLMLDQRSSDSVTYTLCVYETPGKINSGSKYDASFNFRLVDNIEDHVSSREASRYEARIAGLEQKIVEYETGEDPEPTAKEKMWDVIGKIFEHPQVQQAIATKVLSIVDGLGDTVGSIFKKNPVARAAAIGNAVEMDENGKLQLAINKLATVDPALGTHLLQLAEMAVKDPAKYNSLIGMLNLL